MIDFATLQGLTIPEGVVTQIADASGRVLWAVSGGKVILEVEKITSDTYAGETTYTGEQFILLNIYPKTNGTVNVTYGGLTKTITDTSGAAEPNAQKVYFGTFNGVSDSVETPATGELTIEGDCVSFACCMFNYAKMSFKFCNCITKVKSFGRIEHISDSAFTDCSKITNIRIPSSITTIGNGAFQRCTGMISLFIPKSVTVLGGVILTGGMPCCVEIAEGNTTYKIDGNGIVEIATNTLINGFLDTVIPSYITTIGMSAFVDCKNLTSIVIPTSVTTIKNSAFFKCTDLKSIVIPTSVTTIESSVFSDCTSLTSVDFENTSGWYVTTTSGGDASTGTAVDVSDSAANVTMLMDTYKNYYWYRS